MVWKARHRVKGESSVVSHILPLAPAFDISAFTNISTFRQRFRMDYPQPAGEEQGLWGDPEAAVSSILDAGRGMLFQAEGLTFAYNEKGDLFIDGNHFPGISTGVSRIICDNRCLTQSHFEHLLPDLPRALLTDLVSRGFLYGCDGP